MPDTTATALPDWLAAAEADRAERALNEKAGALRLVMDQADKINSWLAQFGIEPASPADYDKFGNLQGAVLIGADYEEGTYEVRALWSVDDDAIELHTADWEDDVPTFGRVRLLNSIGDVAAARHETPKFPAPPRDFAAEARRAMDSLNVDRLNNGEVEVVVTALNGITAALLNLAQVGSRT
ncbi:hypothetical protein [Streptomyces sp. AC1-42T]|uniref:hypothetical protein n=1 Tax=Streptomyces sp. AC1-42T TaxID=2218665 RepID=UPI000DAE15C5|nr:hypothetical protein [Streptomyces sp. AC1-42T]PZT71444.1 hypothetical protein DNK55_32540 [Streptomyces sp. AC1-42T]